MGVGGVTWFEGRSRWWLLGLGLACAVAAALLKATSTDPWWVAAAVAALAFLGTEGVAFLRARGDRDDTRRAVRRSASTGSTRAGRDWPRVADRTPVQLGARKPLVELPYQHRDVEEAMVAAMRRCEPVLLVGPSMAGKSRVAAEVIRTQFPDRDLWQVTPPDGLATLLADGTPSGIVVWLDDLERHLQTPELRPDWLDQLTAPGRDNVVVATMRSSARESFATQARAEEEARAHPQARVVQEGFTDLLLRDSPAETERLATEVPDEQAAQGIRRYGLGTYLGGGHRAVRRFQDGQATHPLGIALVRAAVDWRRIGLETVDAATLRALAPGYLEASARHDPGESTEEGLDWAVAREDEVVQLVQRAEADRYRVTDYLLDHLDAEAGYSSEDSPAVLVPAATWEIAVASGLNVRDAYAVAWHAHRAGRYDTARDLYRAMVDVEEEGWAGTLLANLGALESDAGRPDEAVAWFQRAVDTADPDAVPRALLGLGNLAWEADDHDEAARWFGETIETGHPESGPRAMVNLGRERMTHDDLDAARRLWTDAVETGHADAAPRAMLNLGILEEQAGNGPAALRWWESAVDSGHVDVVGQAAYHLGRWRVQEGRHEQARQLFQTAIRAEHPDVTPGAMVNLAGLELAEGHEEAARRWCETAIASGHAQATASAQALLALLALDEQSSDRARTLAAQALDSGHAEAASMAHLVLGVLDKRDGRPERAREHLDTAVRTGPGDLATLAAEELAELDEG